MRKMKTKILVILCVMIIAGALLVGPVAAASSTGSTTITGNPAADISITANTTATEIALVQGSENFNETLIVNVKANPYSWTLSVLGCRWMVLNRALQVICKIGQGRHGPRL